MKFVDMKLAFGDTGKHIPTNFGKGGMKDIVDRRWKGKGFTNTLAFSTLNVVVHVVGAQREKQMFPQDVDIVKQGKDHEGELSLNEEDQQVLEEHIQSRT